DVPGASTAGNPYHYGYNDPVNRVDPTGMRPDGTGGGISDEAFQNPYLVRRSGWDPGLFDTATDCGTYSDALRAACVAVLVLRVNPNMNDRLCSAMRMDPILCAEIAKGSVGANLERAVQEISFLVGIFQQVLEFAATLTSGGQVVSGIVAGLDAIERIKDGEGTRNDWILIATAIAGPAAALGRKALKSSKALEAAGSLADDADEVADAGGAAARVTDATNSADDVLRLGTKDSWGKLNTLDDHFARHGADFGATSADDYARQASEFLQRPGNLTKIDPKTGVIRVYDPATGAFGAYNPTGTTRTFYVPDPAKHGYPTNLDYWNAQPG
ncbi:MAG TPA: hypothetical protein PKE05_18560, partial [Microthrixaceae bacterium]|nr:hypothetical protein [Microthrixaceae bacterium]